MNDAGSFAKKIKEGFTWLGVVQEGFPPMARGSRGIIPIKLFFKYIANSAFWPTLHRYATNSYAVREAMRCSVSVATFSSTIRRAQSSMRVVP